MLKLWGSDNETIVCSPEKKKYKGTELVSSCHYTFSTRDWTNAYLLNQSSAISTSKDSCNEHHLSCIFMKHSWKCWGMWINIEVTRAGNEDWYHRKWTIFQVHEKNHNQHWTGTIRWRRLMDLLWGTSEHLWTCPECSNDDPLN